jgi:hypothetical protein
MQQCWNPQVPGILTSCAEQTGACVGGGGAALQEPLCRRGGTWCWRWA